MGVGCGSEGDTSLRLFVALWPPPAVRRALVQGRSAQRLCDESSAVAAARLHLTLQFIGALPQPRLAALARVLAEVPVVRPFELVLDIWQVWPRGLGVLMPSRVPLPLEALHGQLGAVLRAQGLPVENRPFRPHVTLSRKAGPVGAARAVAPVRWVVLRHVLVASLPGGRYQVLRRQP